MKQEGVLAEMEISLMEKEKLEELAAKIREIVKEFSGSPPEEKKKSENE